MTCQISSANKFVYTGLVRWTINYHSLNLHFLIIYSEKNSFISINLKKLIANEKLHLDLFNHCLYNLLKLHLCHTSYNGLVDL